MSNHWEEKEQCKEGIEASVHGNGEEQFGYEGTAAGQVLAISDLIILEVEMPSSNTTALHEV
jgi:hypothetical protein